MTFLLGLACGGVTALPFARLARREAVLERVRALTPGRGRESGWSRPWGRLPPSPLLRSITRVLTSPRARGRRRRDAGAIRRELPILVDLVGVAVAAGCTPYLAIEHAARYGPPRTGRALRDVSFACALGQSLDNALRDLGTSVP